MCPDRDHPVHIDVAVANLEGPLSGECCVNKGMERKWLCKAQNSPHVHCWHFRLASA